MSYTILIEGREQFFTGLGKLAERFQNHRKTLEKLGEEKLLIIQKRFASGGPGWPALARSTEARKARRSGGPSRILIDKGDLERSFHRGDKQNVFRINALEGEVGSTDFKGPIHQKGGGRLPQRKIIEELSGQDISRFTEIVIDDMTEDIEAFGFTVS